MNYCLKVAGYKGGLLLPSCITQYTSSSILAYETCPQHRICALGQKSCKMHCFHQHKLPEKPVTLTTPTYQQDISQWPMPRYSRFRWEIISLPVWIASKGVSSSSVLCLFLPLSQSSQHHCYGHFHSAQQTHSFQILWVSFLDASPISPSAPEALVTCPSAKEEKKIVSSLSSLRLLLSIKQYKYWIKTQTRQHVLSRDDLRWIIRHAQCKQ